MAENTCVHTEFQNCTGIIKKNNNHVPAKIINQQISDFAALNSNYEIQRAKGERHRKRTNDELSSCTFQFETVVERRQSIVHPKMITCTVDGWACDNSEHQSIDPEFCESQ